MEIEACTCWGLPAHDHFIGCQNVEGVYRGVYDQEDIGRIWVDWKAVAKALGERDE